MNEITRVDFVEHMAAFERRVNERFDLLERLMALGFDDTSDQLRIGIEQIAAARDAAAARDLSGRSAAPRPPQLSHPPA
jgi:hypothetical protein